jgi:CRP-like cAMP-binding protein
MRRHDTAREYGRLAPFAGCSLRELQRIDGLTTPLCVEPGKVIARQGGVCAEFVVVVSGVATVRRNGHDLEELTSGDHIGEIPLVRNVPHPVTVIARTTMALEVMSVREFRSVYDTCRTVRSHIDRQIDRRVRTWLATPTPAPTPALDDTFVHASASLEYTVQT